VAEEAQRLQALADTPDAAPPALGKELRTLALISLGSAEYWAARFDEAELHLERGAALAQQIGRPFLELTGLAYQAATEFNRSLTRSAERSRQAVELAERHGWADEPAAGPAYMMLGAVLAWQVRPEEAEPWVQRAERTVRAEADPAAALGVQHLRGVLELARGRDLRAVAAFQATERLARQLAVPHLLVTQARALLLLRLPIPLELARGGLSCWRRSQGTHSATAPPRSAPWNAHSISPNPTTRSCGSCSSRRQPCSGSMPGTAPATPR
jgi:LuxR family maltose regulon positive regulatory protein